MSEGNLPAPSNNGGNKSFPILFQDEVLVITKREKEFIDAFIWLQDVEEAAQKAGLEVAAVREFMAGPRMAAYIKQRVEHTAARNAITLDSVLHRISQVAYGKIAVSKTELEGLKMLAGYLKITSPMQVNIGVQVQNNPFKDLSDEDLDRKLKDSIDAEAVPEQSGEGKPA